jgi:pimeloyl-ACP methyl ester carboxylesterase
MAVERVIRDVGARGVRMRVAEAGLGAPVVLLHPFLGSHRTFDDLVEPLASELRVLAPDLPGAGESEKPSPTRYPYGVEAFAEAVVDMVAALGLGRVALVGHGLGGSVALTVAADHPELVERLVLIDALAYGFRLDAPGRLALAPVVGPVVFKQLYGRGTFRRYFRDRVFAPGANVDVARVDRHYDQLVGPAARESAWAVLRSLVDVRPVVARIPRLSTPTLVVWGRDDRIVPAAFGQRLAREIPGARLELLDCGHAPPEERPSELADALLRFLPRR